MNFPMTWRTPTNIYSRSCWVSMVTTWILCWEIQINSFLFHLLCLPQIWFSPSHSQWGMGFGLWIQFFSPLYTHTYTQTLTHTHTHSHTHTLTHTHTHTHTLTHTSCQSNPSSLHHRNLWSRPWRYDSCSSSRKAETLMSLIPTHVSTGYHDYQIQSLPGVVSIDWVLLFPCSLNNNNSWDTSRAFLCLFTPCCHNYEKKQNFLQSHIVIDQQIPCGE